MKMALQAFETGLVNLKDYLSSTENEAMLIERLGQTSRTMMFEDVLSLIHSIQAAHVSRKQYIYTVAIVSLYGLLEQYVNSAIEAHVQRLAAVAPRYVDMPETIIKHHVECSMDLVRALSEDKFRGSRLDEAQVIKNLHSCLSGDAAFRVNGAAFALHRGNLNLRKIGEFLKKLGIQNHLRRVSITQPMIKCLASIYPDRDIRAISERDLPALFYLIDSLVQRRNEVSHGVVNLENLESVELLKERCEFLDAYVSGLHTVLLQEEARAYAASTRASRQLGKPIELYRHCIVCFEINSGEISVGDILIAKTRNPSEPFLFGAIESIEVDHQTRSSISINVATKIAIKVGFHASKKYDYYLICNPNDFLN